MEWEDYVKKEQSDWSFCEGCEHRFKDLEEQNKYCKECLFYLLQED